MLFNSYIFLFAFLPLALAGFFLCGRYSRDWALRWLMLASLVFYAWWRPLNVLIIAPSIAVNFALARWLQRLAASEEEAGRSQAVLAAGILFNVAFLGYFKYAAFATSVANDVFGTKYVIEHVVLPLGISFITFQKIAFLVDVQARRVESFSFEDYCLFVLFFPQLIAGPIVHYREMMPQFHRATCRFVPTDAAVGLTLLCFGLFKKVVLADRIAPGVGALFGMADAGTPLTFLPAWMAAIGFTLQIYFDFSGYTDMALGLARFFGIRFPPNFFSPLKATSIIDFWLRWHMTLTRFLTAYLYNPIALWLTRRRARRGLPGLIRGRATPGAFAQLLVAPTLLTMVVSGVWHGAGYLFVLWGFVHGCYLAVNHAWRLVVPRFMADQARYQRVMAPIGFALTFAAVAAAMVLFRAPSLAAAGNLLKGMSLLHGVSLANLDLGGGVPLFGLGKWTAILLAIALLAPNSLQLLSGFEPAIGIRREQGATGRWGEVLAWRPSLAWAVGVAVVAAVGILSLGGPSEFLYWQF